MLSELRGSDGSEFYGSEGSPFRLDLVITCLGKKLARPLMKRKKDEFAEIHFIEGVTPTYVVLFCQLCRKHSRGVGQQ